MIMHTYHIGWIRAGEAKVAFRSAKDADACADEWVTMQASILEEAFEGYEKAFDAWQAKEENNSDAWDAQQDKEHEAEQKRKDKYVGNNVFRAQNPDIYPNG